MFLSSLPFSLISPLIDTFCVRGVTRFNISLLKSSHCRFTAVFKVLYKQGLSRSHDAFKPITREQTHQMDYNAVCAFSQLFQMTGTELVPNSLNCFMTERPGDKPDSFVSQLVETFCQ